MSYVDLKHLLADLALEAVRNPAEAGWLAVAVACAELTAEKPVILWRDCLKRAETLAAPFGWKPSENDLQRLIQRGLFAQRTDLLELPERFVPHLPYFRRQAPRILKAVAELRGAGAASPALPPEVRIGAALFNAALFFECHEWFEGLWKASEDDRKEFYHGIVQAAAAFYHYEKGNPHGYRTLLRKAQHRLAPYPDRYLGIDLGRFTRELGQWAAHFEGAARPGDYPSLRLFDAGESLEKVEGAPRG